MVDEVGGGSTQKPGGVLSESVPTMAMRCDDETRSDLAFIRAARIYRTLIDPFLVNAQSACYTLGVIQHHQECLVPIVGSPRAARMGHVGVEGVSGLAFRYAVSVDHCGPLHVAYLYCAQLATGRQPTQFVVCTPCAAGMPTVPTVTLELNRSVG